MQIKSQNKVDKNVLNTMFSNLEQNEILLKNVKNINLFFQLFNKIKQHRTLQKICQVYTLQEKLLIFQHYCDILDEVDELMEKFQQYSMKAKLRKDKIKIDKQYFSMEDWTLAIQHVASKGQILIETIESKLKLIIKAFNLNIRPPCLNWQRWKITCTEEIKLKRDFCGCFR